MKTGRWFSSRDDRGKSVMSKVPVELLHDRHVIDNPACVYIIRGIEAGQWSFEDGMVHLVKELARQNKEFLDRLIALQWITPPRFEMPQPDAMVEDKPEEKWWTPPKHNS